MRKKNGQSSDLQSLRQQAETMLGTSRSRVKKMSVHEIQHLVHELQVHQIELEMQNEELRHTQLDLQQSRDRYVDLYDFAPVGFLTLNARGEILEANLTACQLLEVGRKALLGQKLEKFVIAADQPTLRRHFDRVKQRHCQGVSEVLQLKHNHAHFLIRLQSLYEAADSQHPEPLFRLAIMDLTEQELAKASQHEQETWMSAMLDAAMDAIITIDENLNIVLFNASAERMFGCIAKEVLGQSIDRFIPQRFRSAHATHIQEFELRPSAKLRMGRLGEVTGLRANGEKFPIEASISKVVLAKGVRFTVILRDISERRTMEEVLGKEQQFVASVLDATAAIVVVLDPECRIVRFNQGCEKLIGKTIEEMRGKPFWDLSVLAGENSQERKRILALLKGRTFPEVFENAWFDRDHQLRWIKWSNTLIKEKKGKIENFIATGIDITQRKHTENEIKLLCKHNESILNAVWEGIYGINDNGKVTFFNKSAEQLTGWTGSEAYGQVAHSLLHHTQPDGTPYPWKKCPLYFSLMQGKIHSVEDEVLWRKDGTCFAVEYTSTPIYNEDKKVQGAVVTFKDITARKESEVALRESEERFQAFMNFSPTAAFLKDDKGRYLFVNKQFEEKLRLPKADCLGKTDEQLFPPEAARNFIENDQKVLKTKKLLKFEETTLDETGSVCSWLVMKFLIPRKTGSVLLGGVALDITARKKYQETIQQREAELQVSKKMLQALGGQLLSAQENERRRISRELHDDMNQRLAVLAFNIQSTQKGVDPSNLMYQNLQNLYEGVSCISDDVRRLAYQLHPSILDDLGLTVGMQSFVEDFTKYEGIPVDFSSIDVPVSLPQEIASCLYRVTQESLRNVARHAQCTQIEVKLFGVDGGLRLSILDNGKGFVVEEQRLVHHGLGLIGMKERMRVVQGTCEVQSAPGQGTKITVWAPVPKEELL